MNFWKDQITSTETMVRITQQKINGTNNRVKEIVTEVKEFLEKDINEQLLYNQATLLKVKLEHRLDNLKEILEKIDEQQTENDIQDFEDTREEAEILLNMLQMAITNYSNIKEKEREEKIQRELKEMEVKKERELKEIEVKKERELKELENKRERELKELEIQKEKEIEMKKLAIKEKLEMENVSLERLRLDIEYKKNAEMAEIESKRTELESNIMKSNFQKEIELLKSGAPPKPTTKTGICETT